ncbi:hypothetical protein DERP_006527 [Dermatophagoides pteronyssinus]|uniref:Uncharacterized protein n=1 Tax=Dermatophagoides pteronyssinus TaxID=6956 RepID=A0ABQ8IQF4_DERPT|nr:hypothetical protein DERP_006527 [Dermatophagoides pteronyssinus]
MFCTIRNFCLGDIHCTLSIQSLAAVVVCCWCFQFNTRIIIERFICARNSKRLMDCTPICLP